VIGPQNKRAHARSNLSFFDLHPTYHPTGGVQVLQKAWNLLSDDVKAVLQIAESNLNALCWTSWPGRGWPGRALLDKSQRQ
jgi:hypothetical protein